MSSLNTLKILFNGIPSSGKTTYAHRLHLALEHLGFETVLLDDEVIKRLSTEKINTLIDFIDAPVTIIASCNPEIHADIKFWCDITIEEAEKRNNEKLERENAPKLGNYDSWKNYEGQGIKINSYEEVCQKLTKYELNKKN